MAVFSAIFKGVDEISTMLDGIADSGADVSDRLEGIGDTATTALGTVAECATGTARSLDDATASAGQWADAEASAASASDDFAAANDRAAAAADELADATAEAADEAENSGNKMENAVQQLEQVIVAAGIAKLVKEIATAFMECAEVAMTFQTSVAKVSTLVDTTQNDMGEMSGAIRALSNDMGMAADYIAEATYQAISGSVDAADAVQFVAEASKLAVGGFTDSATAVDVLTTAVNAYGLEMEDVEAISSMLITTQNLGKTSVDELASSVGKVIPVAAAYNVEMDNLSTAYAILTRGGIATAESTTYMRSMLNELGDTSSAVAGILQEQTGKTFAQLMDSGYSLADALDILGTTVDGDSEAFMGLWGAQTAGLGATALLNAGAEEFNATLLEMQESSGAVSDAYEIMAGTAQTAKDRMETAHENMAASFGDKLLPVLDNVYEAGAKAFTWMGEVIEEYPQVAALVTGVAVALGVVAVAFAAYTVKTAIAAAATAAFGGVALAALWPLYLAAAAIGTVVAVGVLLSNALSGASKEFNELSASSKQQYEQLERLNAKYEEAVRVHGETSDAAKDLAAQIEAERFAFEATRMTLEEFIEQNDRLVERHDRLVESFRSSMDEIDQQERGAAALIDKLDELANSSDDVAGRQQQMEAIVGRLNDQYPELALSIDEATGSLNQSVDAMKALAEIEAQEQRMNAQHQAFVDALAQEADLRHQIAVAAEEVAAAEARQAEVGGLGWFGASKQAKNDVEDLTAELDRLELRLEENLAIQEETTRAYEEYQAAIEAAADAVVDYETGVSRAVSSVQSDLDELVGAYDAAYEAARSSIDSTIGLFDEMATECEISTNDMLSAWQSQVDYLELYAENLRKAAEYDIDAGLIASLSDGSEESAGYIDAIISEYERLDAIGGDAKGFVGEFNEAFQEVETAKDGFAHTVADMETDFTKSMDAIEARMGEAIDDMNMDVEAAAAAKDTIQAYIDQINNMTGDARAAAANVANATATALEAGRIAGVNRGYAVGTLSAEPGLALVGEEGPELINFMGGEVVYTADETARIISDAGSADMYVAPPAGMASPGADSAGPQRSEKRFVFEIDGKGAIATGGEFDVGKIVDILADNMKPVLMNILTRERLEEGDLSYEF